MLGKHSFGPNLDLVINNNPTICVWGVMYVVMKYKNLNLVLCPQGNNHLLKRKSVKCEKNSKIDLIPISDKLNDTESKFP